MLLKHHFIVDCPDPLDRHFHGVAGLEPDRRRAGHADTAGRAGENDRAGEERRAAAEIADERGDVEDHVAGAGVLHRLAVEFGDDAECVGVGNVFRGDNERTEWTKGVERFAAEELAAGAGLLPPAGGDVVGDAIAENPPPPRPDSTSLLLTSRTGSGPMTIASSPSKSTAPPSPPYFGSWQTLGTMMESPERHAAAEFLVNTIGASGILAPCSRACSA